MAKVKKEKGGLSKRFASICLLDLAFYAITILVMIIGATLIKANMDRLGEITPMLDKVLNSASMGGGIIPEDIDEAGLRESSTFLRQVMTAVKVITAISITLIAVSGLLFTSLIWSKVLKVKFNKGYVKKYFILNASWLVCWGLLLFLLGKSFKIGYLKAIVVTAAFIYIHFTAILRSLYNENKGLDKMLKQTFEIGIKKIHLLLYKYIPGIIAGALLFVLLKLAWHNLLLGFSLMIILLSSIIYFAWFRLLASKAVKEIESNKFSF